MKPLLHSLLTAELTETVKALGHPAWRARQIGQWLYRHRVQYWPGLRNVPASLRGELADRFDLTGLRVLDRQRSVDGTRKFLWELRDLSTVEGVIIPMAEHVTFCISSQVGCGMACRFCATARGGLVRNLSSGEMVGQVLALLEELDADPVPDRGDRRPNIVYMGMGEPLDNFTEVSRSLAILQDPAGLNVSRRRIQISTSGPQEGLAQLAASEVAVDLTLSLGGTTDEERRRVMPVPGRTPVSVALDLAGRYGRRINRRVTIAWVLIAGRTDHPAQAQRLARWLAGGPFKVNLIPLNTLGDDLAPPPEAVVLAFQETLSEAGIEAYIRTSGGSDIAAACGQLRRRRLDEKDDAGEAEGSGRPQAGRKGI